MHIKEKVIVVTGGAKGIGAGLCRRFAQDGARAVAVVDLDTASGDEIACETGAEFHAVDVTDEERFAAVLKDIERRYDGVDLMCSNAGIFIRDGDDGLATSAPNDYWQRIWQVNVMAHVYAARALLPGMLSAGRGYFLQTASAAGLLNQIGGAPYGVSKHAAIAFAESLAITHGDQGIGVSVLCPQGVDTDMLRSFDGEDTAGRDGVLTPEEVAEAVVAGLEHERFLILPHPDVQKYYQRKASDYDRWLGGMRRLRRDIDATRTES